MAETIENPTDFVVRDYADGLCIDYQPECPPAPDVDFESWAGLELREQLQRAGALCEALGSARSSSDFERSIKALSRRDDPEQALRIAAAEVGDAGPSALANIETLLRAIGVLEPTSHPHTRLVCHRRGGVTELEPCATHFGVTFEGEATLRCGGHEHLIPPGYYFAAPGESQVLGDAATVVISRVGQHGLFTIGGPIESWGRLRYIDGCTDTLLIGPPRLGEACLNALYFPPETHQTAHVHPSARAGVVMSGAGECVTPTDRLALSPGKIFFLPPETRHSFHTGSAAQRCALSVVAFHPDSDFGPDDHDHPMLNRTYVALLHRLRSAARTHSD